VAKRLDGEFRPAQAAKSLIEQTRVSTELMKALAQGDLDAIPDSLPTEAAPEGSDPYASLYNSLHDECLAYLQKNLPQGKVTKKTVWDAAARWENEKRASLEKQFTEALTQHLGAGGQAR
jgi:hypothetical protein